MILAASVECSDRLRVTPCGGVLVCRLTTNHTTPMADTAPGVSLPPTRSSRLCSDCYEPVPYVTVRPLDRTSLSHDCPLPTCSTDRTCMDFLECRRLARSHRATNFPHLPSSIARAHRGPISPNLCQSDGQRLPHLMVEVRGNPNSKLAFPVQYGWSQANFF